MISYKQIDKIETEDIKSWSDTDKIKYLFETTDKSVKGCFGKFVFDSFEKHKKKLGSGWISTRVSHFVCFEGRGGVWCRSDVIAGRSCRIKVVDRRGTM